MNTTLFELPGHIYKELAAAVKPHIHTDEHLPLLLGVRLRINLDGILAVDATDAITAIRATFEADPDDDTTPVDVVVPGVDFCSLRPTKKAIVTIRDTGETFTAQPVEDEPPMTGRIIEITDATTTVRLPEIVYPSSYPDLDIAVAATRADRMPVNAATIDSTHLRKLARLPRSMATAATFPGPGLPMWVAGDGVAITSGDDRHVHYQVAIMPISTRHGGVSTDRDREAASWVTWGGEQVAEAA